ncbi:unnamed protein product [Penicillium roqueforti FM164]|uniref:Uncharacterized protein n=1 Tax=Penicillium roqueforti (strain FM164) TaxID=1365484 RepID=W6R9D9_PENRF|nr:unnamed protein product [Penicillium roqueforti FM164]
MKGKQAKPIRPPTVWLDQSSCHEQLSSKPTASLVSHILASSCSITTDELVGIVKPVLEGIQYLRGLGRALATLGPETILLIRAGEVRITDVVTKLMLKNCMYEWEPEIQNLPC